MSNYSKADFVGIWNVTAGARQLLHDAANNRGQKCFNALAQFGNTTNTPPLSWAQQAQQYTIPDVDAVDDFLNYPGVAIRGAEFLNELVNLGVPGAVAIVEAGPATEVSFTVAGVFEIGDRIEVDLTAGEIPGPHNLSFIAVTPSGPVAMAEGIGGQCATVEDITYAISQPGGGGTPVTVTLTSEFDITLTRVAVVAAVQAEGEILGVGNTYTVMNTWQSGDRIQANLEVTDSEGDVQSQEVIITLPPGGPWSPVVVATVIAAELDPVPFVTAVASGNVITLSPTEPGTTLVSSATIL